jgi:hypothetical protein
LGLRISETTKPRTSRGGPGLSPEGVGDVSGDVEVTHRFLFAEAEHGTVAVGGGEGPTKQVVGDPGHRLAAALALVVEGADHVV